MDLTRREFLKDSLATLGFMALPSGLFAAPAGWKPKGRKPNLVFGILTDTHLMVEWDGKSLYRSMTLDYIRKAFKLFKSRNIDAFVHLGDASHRGCVREWEFHKEVFHEVFGKKRGTGNRERGTGGPEKIIIVGNHELMGGEGHCKGVYKDPALWRENAICADVARHYERVWGEPYSEFFHKEVKGYHFFGRHWTDEEYKGTSEKPFADYILSNAGECSLKGNKPFFILSHRRHHFNFCKALGEFPNAVAFMGHWHLSNADWKSIYYDRDTFGGFFPHIEVGACRYDGHNGLYCPDEIKLPEDSSSFAGNNQPSRQAMIVNVYDDMVVFERHEVGLGGKLGPDWVLPLGQYKPSPFSREELKKTIGTPEFGKKAKLEVSLDRIDKIDRIDNRGKAANGKNPVNPVNPVKKGPGLRVKIPLADGNPDSRVYAYNVVVVGDDPQTRFFKSEYFSGVNSAVGHEPNGGVTTVEIPLSELPSGKKLTIAVSPVSSLGTKGKSISTTFRA